MILSVCHAALGFDTAQKNLSKRIDSLNELSFESRAFNRQLSIISAQEAARLSANFYEDGLMGAYLNLGINYTNLSQYDSAFYYLKICEPFFAESDFHSGLIKYYLAVNFSSLRDFERAEELCISSLNLFKNSGYEKYEAYAYNSLGIIKGRQGSLEEALSYFLKAYELKLKRGFKYDEELTNIAIVYRKLGQYEEALDLTRKSLQTCIEIGDTLGYVQTINTLAKIFAESEQLDSAIYYYDLGFYVAMKNGYQRHVGKSLSGQAEVYFLQGRYNESIKKLNRAISITSQKEDVWEFAYYELARIYEKIQKPDSAIHFGKLSLSLSQLSENTSLSRDNSRLLANNFKALNMPDSACCYLNFFIAYKDTLINRNNESRLSDMRIRIETLEQENEIDKLNQEKELGDLKRVWLIAGFVWLVFVGFLVFMIIIYQHRDRVMKHEVEQIQLKEQVDKAQADLYQQTLQMIHTNNCLNEIEGQLVQSAKKETTSESKEILRTIRLNKSLDKDWENFNQYFGSVHAEFYDKLLQACPDLSNHEQRVCALIKLNLSNREIATILSIEAKSVVMLKYRIKKKFADMDKEEDLSDYLKRI